MTVMAAGVSAGFNRALPAIIGAVIHRERINVGTQSHGLTRTVAVDFNNDAALDNVGINLFDAPFFEKRHDAADGHRRIKTEFRMTVNLTADCGEFITPGGDFRKNLIG